MENLYLLYTYILLFRKKNDILIIKF